MHYKAIVEVTLKAEVPDIHGQSVLASLKSSGINGVVAVHFGKVLEVIFEAEDRGMADDMVVQMTQQFLANRVTEEFYYQLQELP